MDRETEDVRRSVVRMVAFGNVGGIEMKSPRARRNKRSKVIEMTLFLLKHEPNGLRIQELQRVIDQAFRFRCSSNSIGQYLKPLVDSGTLEKSHTVEGNAVYSYIPSHGNDQA